MMMSLNTSNLKISISCTFIQGKAGAQDGILHTGRDLF